MVQGDEKLDIVQNVLHIERFDEITFSPAFEKIPKVIVSVTAVDMFKDGAANRTEREADEKFLLSEYKVEKLNESSFTLHSHLYSHKGAGWYIRETEVSWMACI